MPNLTVVSAVDQTSPRDAGHTTSEHFWMKVLAICGIVISVGGFAAEAVTTIGGYLPQGSSALRWAGVIGAVVSVTAKIAYDVSRTLVKMKLVDAEIAASKLPPKPPGDAAAAVLGSDAPEGS